jgi:hypothetical protein
MNDALFWIFIGLDVVATLLLFVAGRLAWLNYEGLNHLGRLVSEAEALKAALSTTPDAAPPSSEPQSNPTHPTPTVD